VCGLASPTAVKELRIVRDFNSITLLKLAPDAKGGEADAVDTELGECVGSPLLQR
jgi:hypothetical protein